MPLPVILSCLLVGLFGGLVFGYGTAMAAIVIVALPTLAFFLGLQRYFIQGITREGLKG